MNKPTKNPAHVNKIRECQRMASRASGSAARVLHALLSFIDADGYCWPLASTLVKVTELWRSKLFSALGELESLGIIDRRMLVSRVNGRNAPTLYRVGGKITRLPKNAERYILASKRKAKSRAVKRVRSPRNKDFETKTRSPQNKDGGSPRNKDGGSPQNKDTEVSIEVAAPIEQADAVAVGPAGGLDSGNQELESLAGHHRHPPSEPTPKPDDDDRAREKLTSFQPKTKAARTDRNAFRKPTIEELKATALANIKAESKNEFTDDVILLAFEVIDERAPKPIRSAKYYETAFRNDFSVADNRSDRTIETQKELRVGSGPEIIPDPNYVPRPRCAQCGEDEKFHDKTLAIKRHRRSDWIEHPFTLPGADDIPNDAVKVDDPDEPVYTEESISTMTEIVLFSDDARSKDYERAFNRAHKKVIRFVNKSGEFRDADKRDSFMETLMRVGSVKQKRDVANERMRRRRKELSESFGLFLHVYPKKTNRAAAKKAWCKIPRAAERASEIIAGVERWKSSERWDDPRRIPDAARFLNEQLWLDDPSRVQLIQ